MTQALGELGEIALEVGEVEHGEYQNRLWN